MLKFFKKFYLGKLNSTQYSAMDSLRLASYGKELTETSSEEDLITEITELISNEIHYAAKLGKFRYEFPLRHCYDKYADKIMEHFSNRGFRVFLLNEVMLPESGINSILITWFK